MSLLLEERSGGKTLEVRVSEKLSREDYKAFAPAIERLIEDKGKISVLLIMENFHGWDIGALWEDIKFDVKHFNDIERVAMVGDQKWEEWMSVVCKPFTTAEVKFFKMDEIDRARSWVEEEKE